MNKSQTLTRSATVRLRNPCFVTNLVLSGQRHSYNPYNALRKMSIATHYIDIRESEIRMSDDHDGSVRTGTCCTRNPSDMHMRCDEEPVFRVEVGELGPCHMGIRHIVLYKMCTHECTRNGYASPTRGVRDRSVHIGTYNTRNCSSKCMHCYGG